MHYNGHKRHKVYKFIKFALCRHQPDDCIHHPQVPSNHFKITASRHSLPHPIPHPPDSALDKRLHFLEFSIGFPHQHNYAEILQYGGSISRLSLGSRSHPVIKLHPSTCKLLYGLWLSQLKLLETSLHVDTGFCFF